MRAAGFGTLEPENPTLQQYIIVMLKSVPVVFHTEKKHPELPITQSTGVLTAGTATTTPTASTRTNGSTNRSMLLVVDVHIHYLIYSTEVDFPMGYVNPSTNPM